MKTIALLPVITYPEPNPEMVVPKAVAMAAALGAQLHALAINVEIRNISNALSRRLVWLNLRGLSAEAMPFVSEDCPVEVSLQERAIEIGADLMIMGAFGHTRLRDFVLGGATKGILSDVRLPIMLSH